MEIKVTCDCGQRYAFEVEPENGVMPIEVACPACSAPGTEKANAIIKSSLTSEVRVNIPVQPPPARPSAPVFIPKPATQTAGHVPVPPVSIPSPAPTPAAPSIGAPTVSPSTGAPRLQLSRGGHSSTPPPAPAAASPAEDPAAFMKAPPLPAQAPATPARKIEKVFGEPNMGKSILGAVIGSAIMTGIWFALWKATNGAQWGVMAIGVGWMAGFFARLIGRSEGGKMGAAVVLVALTFIFTFQFYRAYEDGKRDSSTIFKDVHKEIDKEVARAKEIVKAVPTGSESEIRAYLAGKDGNPDTPEAIAPEAVKEFKEETLVEARDLADEKTAKELKQTFKNIEKAANESVASRVLFWIRALGVLSIFSIIGGAVAAYRFGSGEG